MSSDAEGNQENPLFSAALQQLARDTEEKSRNVSPALLQQAQAIQFLAHLQSILLLNPNLQAGGGQPAPPHPSIHLAQQQERLNSHSSKSQSKDRFSNNRHHQFPSPH